MRFVLSISFVSADVLSDAVAIMLAFGRNLPYLHPSEVAVRPGVARMKLFILLYMHLSSDKLTVKRFGIALSGNDDMTGSRPFGTLNSREGQAP